MRSRRTNPRGPALVGPALLLAIAGCSADDPQVAVSKLNDGTGTNVRPEIGRFTSSRGGCTATLILPQYVLTASHCNRHLDDLPSDALFTPGVGGGAAVGVQQIRILASEIRQSGNFNGDVALLRLNSPIPASQLTPARLSDRPPRTNDRVTNFGFGCNMRMPPVAGKQFFSWDYGPGQGQICAGDSGGPVVLGEFDQGGAIWGVNSFRDGANGDVFGDVPRFKEQILQAVRRMENTGDLEQGIDRPGLDIANFPVPTGAGNCRSACINNADCRAFTYVGPSGGTSAHCWLKAGIPDWVPCPSCTSGIRPTQESDTDRPSADLPGFPVDLPAARPELCLEQCSRNSNCASYTFAPPGFGGHPSARCWLKSSVPAAQPRPFTGLVSGVKGFELGVERSGNTIFPRTEGGSPMDCARRCTQNRSCRAFHWRRQAPNVPGTLCALQAAVSAPVLRRTTADMLNGQFIHVSGVRRGLELNTDRVGGDLSPGVEVSPPEVEECQRMCASNSQCLAYTYVINPNSSCMNAPGNAGCALCFSKGPTQSNIPAPSASSSNRLFSGLIHATFF